VLSQAARKGHPLHFQDIAYQDLDASFASHYKNVINNDDEPESIHYYFLGRVSLGLFFSFFKWTQGTAYLYFLNFPRMPCCGSVPIRAAILL